MPVLLLPTGCVSSYSALTQGTHEVPEAVTFTISLQLLLPQAIIGSYRETVASQSNTTVELCTKSDRDGSNHAITAINQCDRQLEEEPERSPRKGTHFLKFPTKQMTQKSLA